MAGEDTCQEEWEDIFRTKFETEDLIAEVDKQLIYENAFGKNTYRTIKSNPKKLKENLNFAINQLLVLKKDLQLSNTTTENFKKLFTFIKQNQKS